MARRCSRDIRHRGFTLLEILVAVVVMATGITGFITLYYSSVGLADFSRNQAIAANLAQGKISELLNDPGAYVWELRDAGQGSVMERPKSKDANAEPVKGPYPVSTPSILPVVKSTGQHEKALFEKFTWNAYTENSNKDAGYVFLTVVVRWEEPGQHRVLPLTTCVARTRIAAFTKSVEAEVKK